MVKMYNIFIFLDIDGPLITQNKIEEVCSKEKKVSRNVYIDSCFDENCLLNLKKITTPDNSYIIVASAQGKDDVSREILLNKFKQYNLKKKVIGFTKNFCNYEFIDEISFNKILLNIFKTYNINPDIDRFIIITDDKTPDILNPIVVNVTGKEGFINTKVTEAKEKLNDINLYTAFKNKIKVKKKDQRIVFYLIFSNCVNMYTLFSFKVNVYLYSPALSLYFVKYEDKSNAVTFSKGSLSIDLLSE